MNNKKSQTFLELNKREVNSVKKTNENNNNIFSDNESTTFLIDKW